jgi:hypothetical protein
MDGTWVDREELLREDAGKDQLVVRRVVAHGRPMVDIRRHYDTDTNDDDGGPVYAPGKKGVLISEELAAHVGEALRGLAQDAAQGPRDPKDEKPDEQFKEVIEQLRGPEGPGGEPGVGGP